jgi:hypothetical protein
MFRHLDFFDFFRWVLGIIVTVYATIITLQSVWGWATWLSGSDKYMTMLRRYLIIHGLRLRFKTFWGDALISVLLCVAFLIIWRAHVMIYDLGARLSDVPIANQR